MLSLALVVMLPLQQMPLDTVAATMRHWADESRLVGAAAGVVLEGDKGWVNTAGTIRVGGDQPVGLSTRFEIGSITKTITGILLADMVLQGEVALDDPVAKYLPADWTVPGPADRPITLLDLATHTSGLPRMPPAFLSPDPENPYAVMNADSLRDQLARSRLATRPGEHYAYSNLGFALLGEALGRAAGKPWAELVSDRVLGPLTMRRAVTGDVDDGLPLATPHTNRFIPIPDWDFEAYAPAGAIRATAPDLAALAYALINPDDSRVERAVRFAATPRRPTATPGDSVGLGWHITHRHGHQVTWHNGGTGGTRSWVGAVRDQQRAAFFVTNAPFGWVDAVGMALATGDTLPTPPVVDPLTVVPASTAALDRLTGQYQLTPAITINITRQADTLRAQLPGQPRFRLARVASDTFVVMGVDARIAFERDADGKATTAILLQNGMAQRAARMP